MTATHAEAERLIAEAVAREVPEVAPGTVSTRSIARTPGVRTKTAVSSTDPHVDPVVACVGTDECHIRAIRQIAPGEHLDVLPWAATPERFITLALAPVDLVALHLDPDARRATVLVSQVDLPRALGPHGVNRDLASRLVGWQLDIQATPA